MDLYKYYSNPEQLNRYAEADDIVPARIYAKSQSGPQLTPKQINTLAKDTKYAYLYARYILNGPFPLGEDAISKDAWGAFYYARHILKSPFPKGEDAISKDATYAGLYAYSVLKLPAEQAQQWSNNYQSRKTQ